jgi:7-carboxy-7-deazaguanine synthase
MLETNGSMDVSRVPDEVTKIIDIKCPSSGMSDRNRMGNLDIVGPRDEVKFVLADRADYDWAKHLVTSDHRFERVHVTHFAPVFGALAPADLAEWILADRLEVRLGFQLHKIIWGKDTKR